MNMAAQKIMAADGLEQVIAIDGLCKWFGDFQVLADVDLHVRKGEKIVICGPSGSGKSTLIRCINGLEPYQDGSVVVDGIFVNQEDDVLNAVRRHVGMVFQSFNLFPHMTVLSNLTVGQVWIKGLDRVEAVERAHHYLNRVRIGDQANKYPAQLSGGQQQRVAIARALCMQPDIMLFDEPTSALDPEMVNEVLVTVRDLAEDGMTMILVTHEMGFARDVADHIVFMDAGRKVEQASPDVFFKNPESVRARQFLEQILNH